MAGDRELLLAAQREAGDGRARAKRTSTAIGTLGTIIQLLRLPDGTVKVLVEGKTRARVIRAFAPARAVLRLSRSRRLEEAEPRRPRSRRWCAASTRPSRPTSSSTRRSPPEVLNTVAADRRARPARRHRRRAPEPEARGPPGAARADRSAASASKRSTACMQAEIEVLQVEKQDPRPRQEADGELPEGVLPQRADAGDPEGARRARRVQERDPGARGAARGEEDARGGAASAPRRSSGSSR